MKVNIKIPYLIFNGEFQRTGREGTEIKVATI